MTSALSEQHAHSPSILLVEDVDFNREIIALLLGGQGWRIVSAESGEAAIAILNKDRDFQLILMDLGLPGMDGFAAARLIKADPATSLIPILALSAEPVLDRHLMEGVGFAEFLEKTFAPEEMLAVIRRHLAAGDPGQDSASPADRSEGDAIWDLAALRKRHPEENGLRRMAEAFFLDANQDMGHLACAMRGGDAAGIRAACHGLTGAAAIFAADRLRQRAIALAAGAKNGDAAGRGSAWQELIATLAELRRVVARETGYSAPPFPSQSGR